MNRRKTTIHAISIFISLILWGWDHGITFVKVRSLLFVLKSYEMIKMLFEIWIFFAMMRWSRYRRAVDIQPLPGSAVRSWISSNAFSLVLVPRLQLDRRVQGESHRQTCAHYTQFVTVSNTNTPFAIEAPGAEATGGTAYSPILKFVEYLKKYDIQNAILKLSQNWSRKIPQYKLWLTLVSSSRESLNCSVWFYNFVYEPS